jgi:FG-GAP-like repeat
MKPLLITITIALSLAAHSATAANDRLAITETGETFGALKVTFNGAPLNAALTGAADGWTVQLPSGYSIGGSFVATSYFFPEPGNASLINQISINQPTFLLFSSEQPSGTAFGTSKTNPFTITNAGTGPTTAPFDLIFAEETPKSDFNQDAYPDYALLNVSTGQTALWYLQNNVFKGGHVAPTLPAGWVLACAADMDLNGKPDYVLFNASTRQTAIWYLNNNIFDHGVFGPQLPSGWAVVAAADVDHDGKPDYILFNPTTHQSAVWFLNGATLKGTVFGPNVPTGWLLVDANDFNADNKPDFVLFNPSSRQTAVWFMNGAVISTPSFGPTLPAGWVLKGSADFDLDGAQDFVLVNSTSHQTAIWYLTGGTLTPTLSRSAFGPTPAAGYSLASP